jgi:serine/threonine protein kinase
MISGDQAKLIDFGFATFLTPGEVVTDSCGTLTYAAPELLHKRPYS